MTAVKRDGSPPHFHSPLRIGEVMAAPLALEPQNETPHAHPYLPCSPHACDVLRDAQPTHTLQAGQSLPSSRRSSLRYKQQQLQEEGGARSPRESGVADEDLSE